MTQYKKQIEKHNGLKVKRELKALKQIEKDIKKNMDELKEEIEELIYETYGKVDEWNYEELKKYNRLEKMNEKMREKIEERKKKEYKIIVGFLVANAMLNKKDLSELLEIKDEKILRIDVMAIVQTPWSGLSLFERLENNTRHLMLKVKESTVVSVRIDKTNTKKTLKAIAKEIDKNTRNTFMLVDSENTHISYGIIDTVGKKGETVLIYNAILDEGTCSDCAGDNGKIFTYGYEPLLPRHFNCRCFYTVTNEERKI